MDFTSKRFNICVEPYRREMIYCMKIDSILLIIFTAIIFVSNVYQLFVFVVIYLTLEMMTNYYVYLACLIEYRLNMFCIKKVKVIKLREEIAYSGWMFSSAISFLYPKAKQMKRYIIIANEEQNAVLKVRSVMSVKNAQNFSDNHINKQNVHVYLFYGKLSKVLYSYKID